MPPSRIDKLSSEVGDKYRDKIRRHKLQDDLPLETAPVTDSKQEAKDASYVINSKTNGQSERTNNSDSTSVPRSQSFFQALVPGNLLVLPYSTLHDDRRTAARDGRHSGRRLTSERGWWKDTKDEERAPHKTASSNLKDREEKSRAQGGDNHAWRHDRFVEAEADVRPPTKKRRPFREEKLPPESETLHNVVPDPSKIAPPVSSTAGIERWEGRARDRRPLERNTHDRAYVGERSFTNRSQVKNTGFLSRDRFNGVDHDGRYKGKEGFGGRQGYRSSGARGEKWKHDLFDEANRSPSPKKEEDPVAKVEALLSL